MNTYSIGEFAKVTGHKVKTLQRWDRQGYLVPGRTPSNRRVYTDDDLAQLRSYAGRLLPLVAAQTEPEAAVAIGNVRFQPGTCLGILRVELQGSRAKARWSVTEAKAALRYLHWWVAQESSQ